MNHLRPAYPTQQPPSRGRHLERRDQSPSLSFSPTRSRSSSMSLDELLLEATDNKRTSPSSPQPAHAYVVPPSYYRPVSSIRPSRSPDYRSPHPIRRDMSQPNVVSPSITSTTQTPPQPPPQPQPHSQYQTLQTHIFAPPVTGPPGKKSKTSGKEVLSRNTPKLMGPFREHACVRRSIGSLCGWGNWYSIPSPWWVPSCKRQGPTYLPAMRPPRAI
jgi:hypothetical protein